MIDQKFIQTKLTHQLRKAECSGNPAVTNDKCINSTLADYRIYGNSEQDDCGDNLLNIALTPTTQNGITCTKLDDGSYQFTGTSTDITNFLSTTISTNRRLFKAGTYYLPDIIPENIQLILNFYTSSSNGSLKQIYINKTLRSFTITQDLFLSKWVIKILSADIDYDFNFYPQITKTDITEHKPYVSAPTPDVPCEIRSVGELVKDQYNTENIALWLDGEMNTRNGHNTSSTKWEDLSGNNFDFTIGNEDATFNDYALNFAHKGHSGMVSCTADILGTSKSLTIEVCSQLLTNDKNYYWIFSNRQGNKGLQFTNAIEMDGNTNKRSIGQSLFLGGNTGDYVIADGYVEDKKDSYQILHQAITIEEDKIKFYKNGELTKTVTRTLTDDEWGYLRQTLFKIGSWNNGYYFYGNIYSVRVHTSSLTNNKLRRNAEIDLNRFNNKISVNKYEIPIRIKSKNLFNINEIQLDNPKGTYYQPIVTVNENTLQVKARNANAIQYAYFHCDVGKGRKVTLRVTGVLGENARTNNSRVWYGFTNDVNYIYNGGVGGSNLSGQAFSKIEAKTYSITTTSTARYMIICFGVQLEGSNLKKAYANYSNIQVEYGDIVTDYEEYKEPETQSIYLDEPLRAIGDYKDYIDFRQGKVIRNIAPFELKAEDLTYLSTYWKDKGGTYAIGFSKNKIGMIIDQTTKNRCMMEHYKNLGGNMASSLVGFSNYGNINYVFIFRLDFDGTLAQAQQLVSGEKIIYVLATPTEEEIELPKLPQFKGTTVYTIDTETDGEFWCKYKYKN